MNLDYIEIIKRQGKDKFCLDYLEHEGSYSSGWEKFVMCAVNKMEVWISKDELKVKANLPYFLNGHNFFSTKADIINGLQYSSELLNTNLFNAEAEKFEFGTVINIPQSPHDFLSNHISLKKIPLQPFYKKGSGKLTGKGYENKILKLKMYDESQRIKTLLPEVIRADLKTHHNYNAGSNYIRIESHYKKPQIHFKQRTIYVNDLLQDGFLKLCKEDLITTYKSIMKTGIIQLPAKKKDINSATLPLIVLKELGILFDFNPEDLLKQKLKSIPAETLSRNDKKARQRQLKRNLMKLSQKNKSPYDISELLAAKEIT